MLGACVPEATVDEQRNPCSRKDHIWSDDASFDTKRVIHAKAQPPRVEFRADGTLGTRIAPRISSHSSAYMLVSRARIARLHATADCTMSATLEAGPLPGPG